MYVYALQWTGGSQRTPYRTCCSPPTMHGTEIKLKLSSLAAGKHSYLAPTLFLKEASYYVFHTIVELPAILLQPMGCLDYRHIAPHPASLQYFNQRILRVFRHF